MRSNCWLSAALVAALALNVELVSGFWRLPCRGRTGVARIDPLVSPGEISQHAHVVHGASNFGFTADQESLMSSSCTSCAITQDMSAYWSPALYFVYPNGTAELVEQVGGMLAYYLLYGENVTAFPNGFRMMAGDTTRRNFSGPIPDLPKSLWQGAQESQSSLEEKALGFNCLDYAINPEASLSRHQLPEKDYLDANCPDGIRAELMFPSCWNGKDVDSPDHKSHMAYPSLVMDGVCPEGFETRLVSLFFETIWNTAAYKGIEGTFSFSNGDPTGNGYHGDFIAGWDPDFLQQAVDTCTNPSGEVEDCDLFDLQSEDDQTKCHFDVPSQLRDEDVHVNTRGIPGNVQIQWGPEPAIIGSVVSVVSALVSTLFPTPAASSPTSTPLKSDLFSFSLPTLSVSIPSVDLPTVAKQEATPAATSASEQQTVIPIAGGKAVYELVVVEEEVFVSLDLEGRVAGSSAGGLRTLYTSTSTGVISQPSTSPKDQAVKRNQVPGHIHPHAHEHIHRRRGVGHQH